MPALVARDGSAGSVARDVAGIVLVGLAYYVGARIGLMPALVRGQVSPFWPPTGIAVASLLLLGMRCWPGIAVAAFAVNLPLGPTALAAAGIAVGNTAAPVTAALLLRRAGFRVELDRLRDGFALVVLGAMGGMLISATNGVGVLRLAGAVPASKFWSVWSVWWAGDAMGVLVIAPVLFLAYTRAGLRGLSAWRWAEAATLLAGVLVAAQYVTTAATPWLFLLSPLLIWGATRFQQAGAAIAVLVVSLTAIRAATSGRGPFGEGGLTQSMLRLQIFNASVALTALLLAAVIAQRNEARRALEQANNELEERVRDRTAQLEETNKGKDRFLAVMSHELRTPLNAILGFTGTLLMGLPGELNDEQRRQLEVVRSSGNHLLLIISDLLDVSKIESGKVELRRAPVVCQAVIDEVVQSLRPLSESKGLTLAVEMPDREVSIQTDRRALTQILLNLANNAIKFTATGSVTLALTEQDAAVCISVTDTGIGIAADDQKRLFRAFEQVVTSRVANQGTGLGLYISQRLATLLGGKIVLTSEPGVGSRFILTLPVC